MNQDINCRYIQFRVVRYKLYARDKLVEINIMKDASNVNLFKVFSIRYTSLKIKITIWLKSDKKMKFTILLSEDIGL